MYYDARSLTTDTVIDADLCVVGSGPAGLTLAREFLGSGVRVAVIESGGIGRNDAYGVLNDGIVIGDPYHPLRETRHRRVGGSAHIWNSPLPDGRIGAKYVPLDPQDFDQQADEPFDGWPFTYADLEPFYRRAQLVCALGAFQYTADAWTSEARPALALSEFFTTNVYQFGAADTFVRQHRDQIAGSSDIVLCHDLTVHRVEASSRDARVTEVVGTCFNGRRVRVCAEVFVLAAGALENARLLLLSGLDRDRALGNHSGWLGRGLMEHPRDTGLTLRPRSARFVEQARFYDAHVGAGGTVVCGRIGVRPGALRLSRVPNVSVTLLPVQNRIARLVPPRLRPFVEALGVDADPSSYGWSRQSTARRTRGNWRLYLNLEQRPHPDNRIVLSRSPDPLGVPRVQMHWRFRDEEQRALERLRSVLAAEFEQCGLGRVTIDASARIDPNAHHHAGTTRMHREPRHGVVDPDLRVHDTKNLYVAGGSVFPSAGFANPTLTVVALSLRLADHLRSTRFRNVRAPSTP